MRLCDAIRKGCEVTRAIKGHYLDDGCGACAVGSIAVALGLARIGQGYIGSSASKTISDMFPFIKKCPVCHSNEFGYSKHYGLASNVISHIYESHNWTREAIADWIEREFESGARLTDPESKDEPVLQEVLKESVSG